MKYALIALIAFMPACAQLLKAQDQSAEQVAKGIAQICKNTDEKFRTDYLAAVNAKAAPNEVNVTCK